MSAAPIRSALITRRLCLAKAHDVMDLHIHIRMLTPYSARPLMERLATVLPLPDLVGGGGDGLDELVREEPVPALGAGNAFCGTLVLTDPEPLLVDPVPTLGVTAAMVAAGLICSLL
jgi:hypothetical protein